EAARDLCAFIDSSPTPYHAALEVARRLKEAGFSQLDERETWSLAAGDRRFVVRGGSTVVAFVVGNERPAAGGFRMIGAHTDSPNLRVKPIADLHKSGYRQVGVEPYGGVLYSTWLDRDLSIAGRVVFARGANRVESRLVNLERPVARVPQLAIHLNRGVNTDGLVLNAQKHLVPILGVGDKIELAKLVASSLGESAGDVIGYDLMLYDTQKSSLGGLDEEIVYASRLDNLGSCHAATLALLGGADTRVDATRVIVLYDHEECGSRSAVGAQGTVLRDVLARIVASMGPTEPQELERAMSRSFLLSADMAHAVHPNYSDQHEPQHTPEIGKGPVIKTNANQSYATSGETAARFTLACREAGFTPQQFVTRSDLPCGSTIGSITAAKLGVSTVDVGNPMLSMHSCREMAGAKDVALAVAAYGNVLLMAD
ncbi:MAG: M18 family aminopeptidase, partial [Polyangiaceae bacterium]|nr:M18 family aminopeptidase [Polyangiaceae bacterium]